MQGKLQKLEAEARKTGLKINVKKITTSGNRNEQIRQIKIGKVDIEEVQRVNYLGVVIETNGGSQVRCTNKDKQITTGGEPNGRHMENKCSLNKHEGQNVELHK
jgi:hypothetical protein